MTHFPWAVPGPAVLHDLGAFGEICGGAGGGSGATRRWGGKKCVFFKGILWVISSWMSLYCLCDMLSITRDDKNVKMNSSFQCLVFTPCKHVIVHISFYLKYYCQQGSMQRFFFRANGSNCYSSCQNFQCPHHREAINRALWFPWCRKQGRNRGIHS